jgi:CRP-like cAMP-binding protein
MASATSTARPLITKLQNYGPLSSEEEQILDGAISSVREVEGGSDIVLEGTSPEHSTLLLSGFSARYNISMEGTRQITALHVPGDFVDLHCYLLKPMDHSIIALTTCRVAMVPHDVLGHIFDTQPGLARLLWLQTLIDGGAHRNWSIGLGSLLAHQHLAHLICEMYLRMEQIGRTENGSFHVPLTQVLLSQCLALSSVHTNRVVQMLRGEKVIRWERDVITITDWDRLVEIGEFDPLYLRILRSKVVAV